MFQRPICLSFFPPFQQSSYVVTDALAWTNAEDEVVRASSLASKLSASMTELMQRRGSAEVLYRLNFMTEEIEVRSEHSDRRVIFA
jgi:hypothetical protein